MKELFIKDQRVSHGTLALQGEPSPFAEFTLPLCMIERVMENLETTPSCMYEPMKNTRNIELGITSLFHLLTFKSHNRAKKICVCVPDIFRILLDKIAIRFFNPLLIARCSNCTTTR